MQVEAICMGRQESSISKIKKKTKDGNKVSNPEQAKERTILCKYCERSHAMQKELCPTYRKFAQNTTNPITSLQFVCPGSQERSPREQHCGIPNETSREQQTSQRQKAQRVMTKTVTL